MDQPADLLGKFAEAAKNQDEDAAAKCKDEILSLELSSAPAVMARYRLGLFVLHQEKKLDAAFEIFKDIAECQVDCEDRYEAQISYAICLWAKSKHQQAIFELRKVLSEAALASIHKGLALDYLSIFLRDNKASAQDIAKIDEQRIEVLSQLAKSEKNVNDLSQIKLRLAAALEERNKVGDLDQARAILKDLSALASQLSTTNAGATKEALKRTSQPKRR